MDNVNKQLRSALDNAFGSLQGTGSDFRTEVSKAQSDYKAAVPTNEEKSKKKKKEVDEKWSENYKKSIDCNHPKGFSQKAHCQGKKKKENKEATGAGSAGGYSAPLFGDMKETKKKKIETKEATGASSSGSYVTPAAWAKSQSKKDWRGASKTQIPGGKFVQVKKKCTKFPYCNQGDIKALKLFDNKLVESVIKTLSKKYQISEEFIKNIVIKEYRQITKNKPNK
jgi:hypothetical protein